MPKRVTSVDNINEATCADMCTQHVFATVNIIRQYKMFLMNDSSAAEATATLPEVLRVITTPVRARPSQDNTRTWLTPYR